MSYDSTLIEKVKAFGVLGYPAHEIVYLVEPDNPEQFVKDIEDPKHEIYKAFQKGKMTGQYTMDKSLFDSAKANNIEANEKLSQRKNSKRVETAIYDRFKI